MGFKDKMMKKLEEKSLDYAEKKKQEKFGEGPVGMPPLKMKPNKIYVTYEVDDIKGMYHHGDVISGKCLVESTHVDKEKVLKTVEIQLRENWDQKEKKSSNLGRMSGQGYKKDVWAPRSKKIDIWQLDEGSTITPGEKKEYPFQITLPGSINPKTGDKFRKWWIHIVFLQKTGLRKTKGASKKHGMFFIPFPGTDDYFMKMNKVSGNYPSSSESSVSSTVASTNSGVFDLDFDTEPSSAPPRAPISKPAPSKAPSSVSKPAPSPELKPKTAPVKIDIKEMKLATGTFDASVAQYDTAEFIECRYCENQCKFRGIAEKNMKADEDYSKRFFELFREGDLDAVATHIARETISIMETKNPESLLALGLCLYVIGTNILEIPEVLRRRLGRLAKSKIRTGIKEALGLVKPAAVVPAAFVSAAEPAAIDFGVKVPAGVVPDSDAGMEFPQPAAVEPFGVTAPVVVLETWLRSDKEFTYYIDEIVQQSDTMLALKYDLETEGFLTGVLIKVLYAGRDQSGNRVMKLGLKSRVDVPYHLNIIMGKAKEGVIATSIPGDLKNEDQLFNIIQQADVNAQNDRLSLMLNRDKFLRKSIDKTLRLRSPDEARVKPIKVPITIQKRGEQGCDLVIKTFFNESMKPTDLFINVMDGLAENMDYLLELPQEERGEIPMQKEDWFTIKVKPTAGAFSSKFIKRVALPDIPTCPHCDRPLPNAASTDYRRCPFCYEKL